MLYGCGVVWLMCVETKMQATGAGGVRTASPPASTRLGGGEVYTHILLLPPFDKKNIPQAFL